MSKLNELRQKRGNAIEAMRDLIDANPGDKWSDEIEAKYQAHDGEQLAIQAEIKRIERQDKLSASLAELADDPVMQRLDAEFQAANNDPTRRHLATPEYKEAFLNLLRKGKNNIGPQFANALQVGTAAEGGNLVPTELEARLVEILIDWNDFRPLVTTITTGSDRDIPTEATTGAAAWTAEEAAYNESDGSYGLVTLSSHKLTRIIKVSEELVQDSIFDLMEHLAVQFGKAFALAEETAFVAGTNSGQPNGFNTAAATGKTAASATAVTGDELIDLQHSVSRPYRRQGRWVMSDTTLSAIRKLKDGQSQYLWQPGLALGANDMLLGNPVVASPAMPEMTTGLDAITFGDLSGYWIADRVGRQVQVLNELYAANGQVGYRMYERLDGDLVDTAALRNLTMF